ncbi:MAG TPA: hypothetical protein PKE56_08245, partial [Acidimicrobiales bacterium]|nr:hypothetical protein [Acidimicrobiales bacterium]
MTPAGDPPRACSTSLTARSVPEAPNAVSHSLRRKRATTGASSSCAAVRALRMRLSVTSPSPKYSPLKL